MQDPDPLLKLSTEHETITEEAILAFARDFDPQPYHLDPAAARDSIFGALCASGWQICSLMTNRVLGAARASGRPLSQCGIRDLRFRKPVFPGDRVAVSASLHRDGESGYRAVTRVLRDDGTELLAATLLLVEDGNPGGESP